MSKRATDAKVMEYLWPSRRLAQRERIMNSPKITSVGIVAALLLFSALLFGERAEADTSAGFFAGSKLLEFCESDGVHLQTTCDGYIAGVADITDAYESIGVLEPLYCQPRNVTLNQLRKVVIKSFNESPETLHEGAAGLVVLAFINAFPCD